MCKQWKLLSVMLDPDPKARERWEHYTLKPPTNSTSNRSFASTPLEIRPSSPHDAICFAPPPQQQRSPPPPPWKLPPTLRMSHPPTPGSRFVFPVAAASLRSLDQRPQRSCRGGEFVLAPAGKPVAAGSVRHRLEEDLDFHHALDTSRP